jgi:VanZ family protein
LINVLGFIPFGFLGVLWLRQRWSGLIGGVAVLVLLARSAMSFEIEIAQVCMPTRNSSLLDLINNVTGTVFGVIVACLVVNRLSPFSWKIRKR